VETPSKPLLEMDPMLWRRMLAITLDTAYHTTRAVLPQMRKQRYGRIINVSSVTGPLVSNPGHAAYGAAKAGMDGMMRALALEVAAEGITVNAVAPGWIATSTQSAEENVVGANTPMRRAGRPEEVAGGELRHRTSDHRRRRQRHPRIQRPARGVVLTGPSRRRAPSPWSPAHRHKGYAPAD
jgi:NAD(P)-dependent dehydrogenase (short-subunit alcohol dehydrogenase family)